MSQFYDQASLVVVPSGYKAGTVYAQKPLTTDGQLAFTRTGDTATRVNSAGLIEKVRTNLVLQSQTFDNGTWVKSAGGTGIAPSVTANNAIAPDGTMTADTVVFNSGAGTTTSDQSALYQAFTTGAGSHTGSFYAKTASGTAQLLIRLDSATYQKITITSEWQRFTLAQTLTAGTNYLDIVIRRGISEPLNATATVQLWGAQVETGDVATAYIPTTTAAVSVGPVANVPRLDYLGSTCPRLLLEPQRTNLVTFSEQLDNAAWTKTRSTITANNAVSPDGYTNADRITDTTFTANSSFVERQISSVIGTTYTFSAFLKAGTAPFMYVGLYDGANFTAILNAATGAISFTTAGATSTVTAYGNGWYRVSITRTITASASVYPYIGVCQLSNSITYNSKLPYPCSNNI